MNCAKDARKLADFLINIQNGDIEIRHANKFSYYHIGALFTDVVLQAGLNYNTVVKPRVQKILLDYSDYSTLTKFRSLMDREGLSEIIMWKHFEKLERFERLVEFAAFNHIETCYDMRFFFERKGSYDQFLSIKGFGPKSLDYMLKLLNVDSVAVDRHIYSFVKMADIQTRGYQETKRVVEFAADFLNIPRSTVDQIIWDYMSKKKYQQTSHDIQGVLEFLKQC